MNTYYNEFDIKTAAWLRQLSINGDISEGVVDERSITEVSAEDISGYKRVHWFAGIGTWDYCLNQAGWGDREIWTASLPCQPFSSAGKRKGKEDERHLLPHFLELVNQCKPATIIGEQVASAVNFGWVDDLQAELEAQGYAFGFIVLGAHSIGAPHIRQRLYWVAHTKGERNGGTSRESDGAAGEDENKRGHEDRKPFWVKPGGAVIRISNSGGKGLQKQPGIGTISSKKNEYESRQDAVGSGGMGNTKSKRFGETGASIGRPKKRIAGAEYSYFKWIKCADGKQRPIKPGIFPLAYGTTKGMVYSGDTSITPNDTQEARVMRLKGYGNAIQADIAIEFIKAVMDSI